MLVDYEVDERNIYKEKITGTKTDRAPINDMINNLKANDVVVIADLTRVSRSTKDLLMIVYRIKSKGASLKSIKDTWLDTTSNNSYNDFLLTVMSGMAQLERDLISQRTKEGLKSAKARGRNGGKPSKKNEKTDVINMLYNRGYKITEITKKTELSRCSIYRFR